MAPPGVDSMSFTSELLPEMPFDMQPSRTHLYLERGNNERQPFAFAAVNQRGDKLILRDLKRSSRYAGEAKIEFYETTSDPVETNNLLALTELNQSGCREILSRVDELFHHINSLIAGHNQHIDYNGDAYADLIAARRQTCENKNR